MAPTGFTSRTLSESPLLDHLPTSSFSPRSIRHRTKSSFKGLPLPALLRERPLKFTFLILLGFVLIFLGFMSWAHLNTRLGREMQFFAHVEEWSEGRAAFEMLQLRPLLEEEFQSGVTTGRKDDLGAQNEGQRKAVGGNGHTTSSNVGKNGVLGVAQKGDVTEMAADSGNTAAAAVGEQGTSKMQAESQIERGGANSSGTNPLVPHPVVAFVIEALSRFGIQKEPTLEAALRTESPLKMPGTRSKIGAGENDDTGLQEKTSARQSLEHFTDVETSQDFESDPEAGLLLEDNPGEDPVLNSKLGASTKVRKGTPLEQLRRVVPERRPNPIPNPDFWAKAYYGSGSSKSCDLGEGAWVEDAQLEPLETAHCRYTEAEQCAWRRASVPDYRSYRWLPNDCDLPFFDAESFLAQWRDKTVLVVGDSLGRNFFEALLCQLSAVEPLAPRGEVTDRGISEKETDEWRRSEREEGEERVGDRGISDREQSDREIRGGEVSDGRVSDGEEGDRETGDGEVGDRERTDRGATELFWSERFNVTVGRVTSEFLVMRDTNAEELERFAQKAGKDRFLLSLDRLDPAWEALLPRTDLLILNSGHWWVSKSKRKAYLLGGELRRELDSSEAYKIAMRQVRDAVEESGFRGVAIFRTFSDAHYHKGDWDTPGANCKNGRPEETIKLSSKLTRFLTVQEEIFGGSTFRLMEITRLTEYRHDGHVGPREDLGGKWDCTHWCAGGVPDTWLDVMQAMLAA